MIFWKIMVVIAIFELSFIHGALRDIADHYKKEDEENGFC